MSGEVVGEGVVVVEVVYAQPDRAVLKSYRLAAPATVADALRLAAADADFAAATAAMAAGQVGIFGRRVDSSEAVLTGDRVEIYRPPITDPKLARRARARVSKSGRS